MRGSSSLETLIIILVAIYVAAIVYKGVVAAGFVFASDEYRVAAAKLAADKIANVAQMLKTNAPGTPKTVEIYLPENTELRCNTGTTTLTITVQTEGKYNNSRCSGNTCTGSVDLGLQCDTAWNLSGPIRKEVALVKIGADRIRIGDPV